ncbi:glycoside hydrolase family 79 protein [Jackrogersella minutella]|nr:glycoside hydrolase family 79 protein [Jackrogersella minutella]
MYLIKKTVVLCHLYNAAFAASDNIVRLEPSVNPPPDISSPVDPSFAGFGIEASNLFSFTGGAEPNNFTLNLLNNLANYTGKPPNIRIGGNTQDYMLFQETHDDWTWIDNRDAVGQGNFKSDSMLIGNRFFETANRLPKGTTVTWGLNLAYQQDDYIEKITTMARQVLTKCPNLNITSFEIGNEPDLYSRNGFRAGEWGGKVYTQQWLDRASAISTQVLQPHGIAGNFFEAAATASTIGTDFQIANLEGFDISTTKAAGSAFPYLSGWNQHDYYYYIGVSEFTVTLEYLLRLRETEDQLTAWREQIAQARKTPYPYALREMGVVGPIGLAGVTDVFGAALWTLNFLLYAASLGVAAVGLHMTDNSNASAWQPVDMYGQPPHVRPIYYGVAAFDEAIGSSNTAQVARHEIAGCPEGYEDFVRAYDVYRSGRLAAVVVVNGMVANSSLPVKGNVTVELQLPVSAAGQVVYLAYLTSAGADATANTTWNGVSFEQSGDGTPAQVSNDNRTVQVAADGTANFTLRDSEAVVASLGEKVGNSTAVVTSFRSAKVRKELGSPGWSIFP